jgi:inhibitor of KinA sporulation pathway (predicted exonuclease)
VNEIRLPKAKDAAIIQLLRSYVKPRKPQLIAERVRDIYGIRNDLVHNAIENPDVVDKHIRLLREIAFHLFRSRVGIPFEITPELVPLL